MPLADLGLKRKISNKIIGLFLQIEILADCAFSLLQQVLAHSFIIRLGIIKIIKIMSHSEQKSHPKILQIYKASAIIVKFEMAHSPVSLFSSFNNDVIGMVKLYRAILQDV